MQPFLRLASFRPAGEAADLPAPEKGYQEALVKLIPSEIVGLYLGGKNAIEGYFRGDARPPDAGAEPMFWMVWTVLCFVALIAFRRWATSDEKEKIPPEWPAISLAATSFLVWVYSFGDVFEHGLGVWHPVVATLLVLAWTFSVPLIYRMISDAKQP
ncbi:MAG: hypothetical protein ACKVRO_06880 [Micropepsaceae bacterium]